MSCDEFYDNEACCGGGDCQVVAGEDLYLLDTGSIARFLKYGKYCDNDYIINVIEMLDDAPNIIPTLDQLRKVWGALTMALKVDSRPCEIESHAELEVMWACFPHKQIMPELIRSNGNKEKPPAA